MMVGGVGWVGDACEPTSPAPTMCQWPIPHSDPHRRICKAVQTLSELSRPTRNIAVNIYELPLLSRVSSVLTWKLEFRLPTESPIKWDLYRQLFQRIVNINKDFIDLLHKAALDLVKTTIMFSKERNIKSSGMCICGILERLLPLSYNNCLHYIRRLWTLLPSSTSLIINFLEHLL